MVSHVSVKSAYSSFHTDRYRNEYDTLRHLLNINTVNQTDQRKPLRAKIEAHRERKQRGPLSVEFIYIYIFS